MRLVLHVHSKHHLRDSFHQGMPVSARYILTHEQPGTACTVVVEQQESALFDLESVKALRVLYKLRWLFFCMCPPLLQLSIHQHSLQVWVLLDRAQQFCTRSFWQ